MANVLLVRGFSKMFSNFICLFYVISPIILITGDSENCKRSSNLFCECDSDGYSTNLAKILPTENHWTEFTYLAPDKREYFYNPCVSIKVKAGACEKVLMCQRDGSDYYPLARDSVSFEGTPKKKNLVIRYVQQFRSIVRNTSVSVICDKSVKTTTFTGQGEVETRVYSFVLTTSSAVICNPGPSSGISTGSILLILFFVLITVYLVAGVLIQHFLRGASGVEMIPNITFWRQIPGLIRDGMCFVVKCGKTDDTYDRI